MNADALTLIRELQADLAGVLPARLGTVVIAPYIRSCADRIEALEPFRTVAQGWVVAPLGGGCIGPQMSVQWVVKRLLAGADPEAILESATRVIEANQYEGMEIRPVRGISVLQRHQLSETAYLCPKADLPSDSRREEAFPLLGPGYENDTAALVQTVVVAPAIVASPDVRELPASARARQERAAFADRLRLVLGLASGNAVEMAALYGAVDDQCILNATGGCGWLLSPYRTTMSINNVPADIDATLALMPKLTAMRDSRALELSIDRLLRSRLGGSLEDRIIDLGMAAEIALMHSTNPGDGKTEITNKLGTRGAWLLGTDAGDRLRVYRLVTDLYSARSTVVHTGVGSAKDASRIPEFDKLASEVALALLDRGQFPDWKSLTLGGAG